MGTIGGDGPKGSKCNSAAEATVTGESLFGGFKRGVSRLKGKGGELLAVRRGRREA